MPRYANASHSTVQRGRPRHCGRVRAQACVLDVPRSSVLRCQRLSRVCLRPRDREYYPRCELAAGAQSGFMGCRMRLPHTAKRPNRSDLHPVPRARPQSAPGHPVASGWALKNASFGNSAPLGPACPRMRFASGSHRARLAPRSDDTSSGFGSEDPRDAGLCSWSLQPWSSEDWLSPCCC